MKKKLYFIKTNGYNMVVSVDEEKCVRYLTETNDFPYIVRYEKNEQKEIAKRFLLEIEDDSSWCDNCTYEQIFGELTNEDEILAEVENAFL